MSLACLLLGLLGQATDTKARVAEVLARATSADDALVAPLAKELGALSEVDGLLLEVLVDGRVPEGSGEDADAGAVGNLSAFQERVVLEALCSGDQRSASSFLEDVRAHPEPPERVAVALRLLGRIGRTSELADARAFLRAVEPQERARVEEAFERGLLDWLAREPELFEALPTFCGTLSAEHASLVVRALAKTESFDAPRCLRRLLGPPAALQACILQALASTADLVPREEALDLAEELGTYLDSDDEACAVAAANALGRLRVASSISDLLAHLDDEPPLARAVLAALRVISGTRLAASPIAWRHWYAGEEAWRRGRAAEISRTFERGARDERGRARLAAALGELSEHPLYRDELAPIAGRGLDCADPGLRVLTCAALERLGSRAALPNLWAHLDDADEEVAGRAYHALQTIARVDLPRDRERWATYLRQSGWTPDDAPRSPREF